MRHAERAHEAASLLGLLEEQVALFEKWLELEGRRDEAVQRRDEVELRGIVELQTRMLFKLDGLEARRRASARRLVPGDADPTLQQVADAVPSECGAILLEKAAKLRELLLRVQESARRGEVLLRLAAAHNQAMLQVLSGSGNAPGTYAPPGNEAQNTVHAVRSFRIDRQA